MGFFDKFLDAVNMDDDYDDDFFDEEFGEEEKEVSKPRKSFLDRFKQKNEETDKPESQPENTYEDSVKKPKKAAATTKTAAAPTPKQVKPQKTSSSKITPMRNVKKSGAAMEVCVFKPVSMEDTREIADTLIDNCTVVLNLEGVDVDLAQRIIDFTLGSCYSLGGSLQKISSYIFIISPYNVDVSGDFQSILGDTAPAIRAHF